MVSALIIIGFVACTLLIAHGLRLVAIGKTSLHRRTYDVTPLTRGEIETKAINAVKEYFND